MHLHSKYYLYALDLNMKRLLPFGSKALQFGLLPICSKTLSDDDFLVIEYTYLSFTPISILYSPVHRFFSSWLKKNNPEP